VGRRRGDFLNPVLARPTDGLRDRMNLVLGDCVKALWRGSFSGHGGGEKELPAGNRPGVSRRVPCRNRPAIATEMP
jgi:hypothetical protein